MGGISLKIGTFLNFLHYYRQIFAKIGTHDKIALFLPFSWVKLGTVPIK